MMATSDDINRSLKQSAKTGDLSGIISLLDKTEGAREVDAVAREAVRELISHNYPREALVLAQTYPNCQITALGNAVLYNRKELLYRS